MRDFGFIVYLCPKSSKCQTSTLLSILESVSIRRLSPNAVDQSAAWKTSEVTGSNLRLGQYSFRNLMIVIATGIIPLSPMSSILMMVLWESSSWLGNNSALSTYYKNSGKAWIGRLAAAK